MLPYGARIVNIARGSLIDEDALVAALDSGHISAAGLDVHAREPRINERFVAMTQVCLTCHTGGASVETNHGFERLAMENVEAVLQGKEPLTAVNHHLIGHSINGTVGGDGGHDVHAVHEEQEKVENDDGGDIQMMGDTDHSVNGRIWSPASVNGDT
ncbi:MAG: hypothetical protein Q9163_004966, partial [Psora crenata]